MRISTPVACGTLLCLLCIGGCKKTATDAERGYSALNPRTRIVQSGPYELALELMTMDRHEQMMRRMNLTMRHAEKAPYVLMLTIIDKKKDRLVRDATVKFELMPAPTAAHGAEVPPNKSTAPPRIVVGMIMADEKMFHYAADFPYAASGIYKVRATIRRAGAPTVRQEVEFEL